MNPVVLPESENFLGIRSEISSFDNSRVVIQQIPYEHTSSYRLGSSMGPNAIIRASHYVEFYDEEIDTEACENVGICTLQQLDFLENEIDDIAVNKIKLATEEILSSGKFVVSLGAEHTVSLGLIEAHLEKFPYMSVLQIDAHSDLRNEYENNKYSHASVMARVNELNVPISQVGIRAQSKEESQLIKESQSIHTLYDHQLKGEMWIETAMEGLSDQVYITIDTDGLDPSLAPAVGTPEPGGLSWKQCLDLFRALAKSNKKVVGFDIVELAPLKGDIRTEYTMAKLLYKLIGYLHKYQKL
jgi:agmatinase